MNVLRNVIIPAAAAAAFILPAAAFAQQAPPPANAPATNPWQGERGHRHGGFMRLMRNLNLTDAQKARIRQIRQQYRQAHPEGSTPDPQARKQMRDEIMSVLTPQQRTQLQQEIQRMRQQRGSRPDNDSAGPQPQATPQP